METKHKKADIGGIVGRFQIPELHSEHRALIDLVLSRHDKVAIFLGVSRVLATRRDPYDFSTRKAMILANYPPELYPGLVVLPIGDRRSNEEWSRHLDEKMREAFPMGSVLLYGGRDSFMSAYSGSFPCEELESTSFVCASEIRNSSAHRLMSSADFRLGVLYSVSNRFPIAYSTVDIAIVDEDRRRILLGRKPGEKDFRFVGGFVDATKDKSKREAARREAMEETGLEIGELQFVDEGQVNDWRYRNQIDKVFTTLWYAPYIYGCPCPKDDIEELRWFNFSVDHPYGIDLNILVEEHRPFFKNLFAFLKDVWSKDEGRKDGGCEDFMAKFGAVTVKPTGQEPPSKEANKIQDDCDSRLMAIPPQLLATIPGHVCRRFMVLPIGWGRDLALKVAVCEDVETADTVDSLIYILKRPIEVEYVAKEDLLKAIEHHHPKTEPIEPNNLKPNN